VEQRYPNRGPIKIFNRSKIFKWLDLLYL
jgi:hypothetical protein